MSRPLSKKMRRLRRAGKGRGSLGPKIAIALASLILALAALEVALRYMGPAGNRSEKIYRAENLRPGPKILCVGDSFTHGGMAQRDETYPYYLERMIHASSTDHTNDTDGSAPPGYRVINAGMCAMNTREMWEHLPGWVETFKPEVLLLLAGSANWFSPLDYDLYRRGDIFSTVKRRFFQSRVVKMFFFLRMQAWGPERLIRSNELPEGFKLNKTERERPAASYADPFRMRLDERKAMTQGGGDGSPLAHAWKAAFAGDVERSAEVSERADPRLGQEVLLLRTHALFQAGRFQEADAELTGALEQGGETAELGQARAYYRRGAADRYRKQRRIYESLEWYLKAVEADPGDPDNYSWIYLVSGYQSRYSAADVLAVLDKVQDPDPNPAAAEARREALRLLGQRALTQADYEKHTYEDLEPVVDLCRKHGVRLVVLNYPISYPMINGVLERLAVNHDLPFVDILAVFRDLEPRERFILDDEHCTPEGHQVMAENVYRTLVELGLLRR